MSRKTVRLAGPLQRKTAHAYIDEAPQGWVMTLAEPKRNLAINAALHAKISDIAATREWAGKQWDIDIWKRLLVAAWHRATGQSVIMLPALDGAGVDIVFRKTSKMTQAECRDLLAFIEAWEAETESTFKRP